MNKTKFEIIIKNGKPFMRMTTGEWVSDMKIYKVKSDRPYVRRYGEYFYLEKEMIEEMKKMLFKNMSKEEMAEYQKEKDRETEKRINGEIDACGMAYKIKDSESNQFVFGGIENGLPWYRANGGSTHITDLTGFEIVEKYIKL